MATKKHFELICQGCNTVLRRRQDKVSQSPYCRPCRGKKTLTKHNDSYSRLYKIWIGMKERCQNPNSTSYVNYGGRGISICEEWSSYENFKSWSEKSGYQDGLSIDRINNDLGYEPQNCRWATKEEQGQNRRGGLDWDKVRTIRRLCPTYLLSDIAKQMQVSKETIGLVANNKIWFDPNYVPTRHHRWKKKPLPTSHPTLSA